MPAPKPTLDVTFSDPTGDYTSQSHDIIADCKAGFAMWTAHLAPSAASIEVNLHIVATADHGGGGTSVSNGFVGTNGAFNVFEQGAAYELRTGIDPNGAGFDVDIYINAEYLDQYYWINPLDGSHLPANRNDLVDVLGHEFGHALGFNGWRDYTTYALPDDYESTFDAAMEKHGGYMYFNGAHAHALYGDDVPLTAGNVYHLGNNSPHPGADLIPDLMNGVQLEFRDYVLSDLDIAIMSDIGLATELSDRLVGGTEIDHTFGGDGNDTMFGGDGNDALDGGNGNDRIEGDAGADKLTGGKGKDVFVYTAQSESRASSVDTLAGFNASQDRVDVWFTVKDVDRAVNGGALTNAHFATDLEHALGGSHLKPHHAVLFTPSSGNFNGKVILAIDVNNVQGFQANADLVIVLDDANLNHFGKKDFAAVHDIVADNHLLPMLQHVPPTDAFNLF